MQARFLMLWKKAYWWYRDDVIIILKAVMIIHSIIIENEQSDPSLNQKYLFDGSLVMELIPINPLISTRFS
jgi:hypothetical protein